MHRGTKLFLLVAGVALLAPASASATKTVAPPSMTFPDTPVDGRSAPQTFTYSIDAAESDRFVQPEIENCAPNGFCDFEITATTCPSPPAPLPPGNASCTATVVFTPYLLGFRTRNLQFRGVTAMAALSGKGVSRSSGGKKKKCKKKGKKGAVAAKKKGCKKKKK